MASPACLIPVFMGALLALLVVPQESNAIDLTKQRPEGLFTLVKGQATTCSDILNRLNAAHDRKSSEGTQEVLLHTGLEAQPYFERYFTLGNDLREYEAWKTIDPASGESVTLFRHDGWLSGFPAQFLFYAPTATVEAQKDGDGILPFSFISDIRRATEPNDPARLSPVTARTFGQKPSSFGHGKDVYTNSIIEHDGQVLVLLAPWLFESGALDLTRKSSVYAVNIPAATDPLCEFSVK